MPRTSHVGQVSLPRVPLHPLAEHRQPVDHGQRLPQSRRWRCAAVLLSILLCLAAVGIYMWPRLQVVRLAYRMQASEQRLNDLRQERDDLRRELASLKDPQRLYRVATEQLGMGLPRHDQVFFLSREPRGR